MLTTWWPVGDATDRSTASYCSDPIRSDPIRSDPIRNALRIMNIIGVQIK
jgi:hypothetical protein